MERITHQWLIANGYKHDGYGEYYKGNIILDSEYTYEGFYCLIVDDELREIDIEFINQIKI